MDEFDRVFLEYTSDQDDVDDENGQIDNLDINKEKEFENFNEEIDESYRKELEDEFDEQKEQDNIDKENMEKDEKENAEIRIDKPEDY